MAPNKKHPNEIFTESNARLRFIKSNTRTNFNWVFLPGGPGLGSESLYPLTKILDLPGTMWHLDLPGDGSNHTPDDAEYFSHWSQALIEAIDTFENTILVAHSTGGMFALATPALEKKLTGLVLMDSAPDASWQKLFASVVEAHPIPEMEKLHQQYVADPNDQILKELTIISIPYLFTKDGLKMDISFLNSLPYNHKTCDWSAKHFDQTYKARWVPKDLPTLILSGEYDQVTFDLFSSSQQFLSKMIMIRKIKNAAHFPWIENPQEVIDVFTEFVRKVTDDK
jgi:pimeloyl-ACP methyl ester carboxylesterase